MGRPYPQPLGSIPACAGEARCAGCHRTRTAVYPRVCGGSWYAKTLGRHDEGLSPRVRGKRFCGAACRKAAGSIPACAGEAFYGEGLELTATVYPRVCGGSLDDAPCAGPALGLSPRVRGKRWRGGSRCPVKGSIPACAGEAHQRRPLHRWQQVYPRVCGGSDLGYPVLHLCEGLSPRVRGKRITASCCAAVARSIPACAGEAFRRGCPPALPQVYPRVCGGSPQSCRNLRAL